MAQTRIALVDDEASVRVALGRLLRLANYEVLAYASGEEFLAALGDRMPDCALLDVHLPGLTGIQVQLRLPHGVRSMRQLVVGKAMRHRERNGVVTFTTPRLHSLALFAVNHAWSLGQPRCEGAESRTRRASGSSPARSTPRR